MVKDDAFKRFKALTERLLSVPKEEVDKERERSRAERLSREHPDPHETTQQQK